MTEGSNRSYHSVYGREPVATGMSIEGSNRSYHSIEDIPLGARSHQCQGGPEVTTRGELHSSHP